MKKQNTFIQINHAPDHQRSYIARAQFVFASLVRVARLRALGSVIYRACHDKALGFQLKKDAAILPTRRPFASSLTIADCGYISQLPVPLPFPPAPAKVIVPRLPA